MDELNEYLKSNYPNNYITGDKDCNLLLWGKDGTDPRMLSLVVGVEYDPNSGMETEGTISDVLNCKYQKDSSFKQLIKYGEKIGNQSKLPFIILVYPALREKFEGRWDETEKIYDRKKVIFYWYDFSKEITRPIRRERINGEELMKRIYSVFEVSYSDEGTSKNENSHLSDYFHYWSRETLSKNFTKLDIDGMIINNTGDKGILVEIKRSSIPPIPKWKPDYDKANYILQSNYANRAMTYFWLLHHESRPCDDNEVISFYRIDGVDEKKEKGFIISEDVVVEMNVSGDESLKVRIEKFISNSI